MMLHQTFEMATNNDATDMQRACTDLQCSRASSRHRWRGRHHTLHRCPGSHPSACMQSSPCAPRGTAAVHHGVEQMRQQIRQQIRQQPLTLYAVNQSTCINFNLNQPSSTSTFNLHFLSIGLIRGVNRQSLGNSESAKFE